MEKYTFLTDKLVALNYLQKEYEEEVEKIIRLERWLRTNPDESKWSYIGPTGSKARLSRLRLTINEIKLELERGI